MHGIKVLRCEDSIVGNNQARINSGNEWLRWIRKKKSLKEKHSKYRVLELLSIWILNLPRVNIGL